MSKRDSFTYDDLVKGFRDDLATILARVETDLDIRRGIGAEIAGGLGDLLIDIDSWMGWDDE